MDLVKSLSSLGMSERYKLHMTLRIIGEMISTASIDESLQIFFAKNGLDTINLILKEQDMSMSVEVLWILSNIACDTEESAMKVVCNDVFNTVIDKLAHSVDF